MDKPGVLIAISPVPSVEHADLGTFTMRFFHTEASMVIAGSFAGLGYQMSALDRHGEWAYSVGPVRSFDTEVSPESRDQLSDHVTNRHPFATT